MHLWSGNRKCPIRDSMYSSCKLPCSSCTTNQLMTCLCWGPGSTGWAGGTGTCSGIGRSNVTSNRSKLAPNLLPSRGMIGKDFSRPWDQKVHLLGSTGLENLRQLSSKNWWRGGYKHLVAVNVPQGNARSSQEEGNHSDGRFEDSHGRCS